MMSMYHSSPPESRHHHPHRHHSKAQVNDVGIMLVVGQRWYYAKWCVLCVVLSLGSIIHFVVVVCPFPSLSTISTVGAAVMDGITQGPTDRSAGSAHFLRRCMAPYLKIRPSQSNQFISKLLRFDYHNSRLLFSTEKTTAAPSPSAATKSMRESAKSCSLGMLVIKWNCKIRIQLPFTMG